ncbi:MAG TPA: glycosyltransferase family 39 protein [Pyrinomonadaceae bacterium]|jgi:4-amino-4-deoxy-L-arabinose transferase-like glycosyltransferase|nr:glycosyltransferase family 39 protein [Pyrinomonadaceae bacterium]
MTPPRQLHGPFTRRGAGVIFLLLLAAGLALYASDAATNPPGFYIDESSIAYNAHTIARDGRDEHEEAWPLFFRAFGDYKNPTYVYLLAALFRLTGPSILAARLLSATLGAAAALVLGLLGARVAGRREVGLFVCLTALLTPWLFELSRVVVEVAMYPLALALFLLCVRRASERHRWTWADALALAATLALLTYTYSIGRLLGPLLALGLALFATRARLRGLLLAWSSYALSLAPLLVFQLRHPGALGARFRIITYITPQSTFAEDAWEFVRHYAANLNPWRMLVAGDPNAHQIASIYGTGPVLAATFVLAVAGACLMLRRARRDAWGLFLIYGLAASFVPASLTNDDFHLLRLAAVPVFLVALAAPALAWLLEDDARTETDARIEKDARTENGARMEKGARARRALLVAAVALTLAQGLVFQWQYRASARSPRRLHLFDADYTALILPTALDAAGPRPVYLADAPAIPGYIQARWQATLRRIPHDEFVLLAPDAGAPEGAVVITTEDSCPRCRVLAQSNPYTVYVAEGEPRAYAPLDAGGFRAELSAIGPPAHLRAKEQTTVRVRVRNTGDAVWLARERGASPFQLSAGNHWLDASGNVVANDDGRAPLLRDLHPGEEAELPLVVNAPRRAGDYLLEIDVLQEGVSWFGPKGSNTLRVPLKVE